MRELVSGRQVTTLISNHTFSNLVLRPNGAAPDTVRQRRHAASATRPTRPR